MNRGVILLLILGIIFSTSCTKSPKSNNNQSVSIDTKNQSSSYEEDDNRSNITVNLRSKIHPSLPIFLFRIYGKKPNEDYLFYSANKVVVIETGNKQKIIQEIKPEESETINHEDLGLIIEDMNFDGYKDIRIQCEAGVPYYYWLWDKKTLKFVPNKELEEINDPLVDTKNKTIKSFVRISGGEHAERIYKFINGTLKLIWEEESVADSDSKLMHFTVRTLKGNRMEVTKKYDEPLED